MSDNAISSEDPSAQADGGDRKEVNEEGTPPGNQEPSQKTSDHDEDEHQDVELPTRNEHKAQPPFPNKIVPPLPTEEVPPLPEGAPPLPAEAPPVEDDGWEPKWDDRAQAYYFFNRFTNVSQWDNPRVPEVAQPPPPGVTPSPATRSTQPAAKPVTGGYDPAIHGDYDQNADYAQVQNKQDQTIP
jgi:hypothetical protein